MMRASSLLLYTAAVVSCLLLGGALPGATAQVPSGGLTLAPAAPIPAPAAEENATALDLALPIPLTTNPRCPWLEGVIAAAETSTLVRALITRSRMATPFGPGSWPEPFALQTPNEPQKFGWKGAVVLSATVRIDEKAAARWLPKDQLQLAGDTAEVFIAWYPDSFCCGPYHEAAILLNVEHGGKPALHCPWMLVDSDRSMIAGREVLGFPKKMGQFKFTVTSADGTTIDTDDPAFDASKLLEPGVTVAAEVWRGGAKLLSIAGTLDRKPDDTEKKTIFPGTENVFLNIQTNQPLPPNDPADPDPMCLGNRPRLLQFVFDEEPTDDVWQLAAPAVSINQTKTDAIGRPFGIKENRDTIGPAPFFSASSPTINEEDSDATGFPLEVLAASFGVTDFYTGLVAMPTMGPTIGQGYLEDNSMYWLRYQ